MPGETLRPDPYDGEPLPCPLEADCREMACPGPTHKWIPGLIVGYRPVTFEGEYYTCTVLDEWLGGKPLPPDA